MNQDMDQLDSIISGAKARTQPPKPPGTHYSRTPPPEGKEIYRPEPPPAPEPPVRPTPTPPPGLPEWVTEDMKAWDTQELDVWGDNIQMHIYQDMPWSDVWGHARKNALSNAGRLGVDLAKFVAYNFIPKKLLFHEGLKKEASDLHHAIGMLAVGLVYKGLKGIGRNTPGSLADMDRYLADTYGMQPDLKLFQGEDNPVYSGILQHPKVQQIFAQPEMFVDAMIDMYKTNYGFGKWGEAGLKRYIAEEPLDFISDVAMVLTMGIAGAGVAMKASASGVRLSMRLSHLNKLQINKYLPRGRRVEQVYDRVSDIYRKLPKVLDDIGDEIWYIGTGVKGGNHPPGFWAKMAHYALTYADAGSLPFLVGGQAIQLGKHLDVLGIAAGRTKNVTPQDVAGLAEILYKELYVKNQYYSRRNPARTDPYTAKEVSGFLRNASPSDYKNPQVPNYDVAETTEMVRFIRFDTETDAYVPCLILDPRMYLRNEENIARELQSLGTLSPDEFLKRAQALEAERAEFLVGPAFGKEIIPLDDLNAEELAQYGIKRTGDIETLSLGRADRDAEAAFRSGGYMGETSPFFINYQSTDPDVLIRYLDADVVGGEPARSMPFVMEDADGAFRAMERKLDEKFRAYNNHDETVPGSGTFQEAEDAFYDTLDEMAELVQERIGTGAAADMRTLSDLELEAYGVTRRYNPEARGIYSAIPREPLPVRKTPDSTLERHRSYMEAIRGIEEGLISEVAQVTDAYKLGHITFTGARQIGDQLYESLHNKYKDIRLNDVYNFDTYNNTIAVLTEILGDNFDATRGAQKQLDKFGKLVERFVQANEERLTGTKVYGFRGPSLSIEINRLRENSEALRAALQDPNLSAAELETHVQRFRDLQEAQHALTLKNTGTGTLGEWAKVRENLLKMMLKENMGNDHRFYKLYNAMMADYYRNLRELLETRIYAPPHFHIISRGLSNPQKNQIVKEALKTYVSFHVIDKKATEQFSPKYSSLFDDFSQRSVAAKEAGASTDIYPELQNVFWNGFLDYLEDNYIQNIIKPSERTAHNVDNMMAQLRANVETMQPEIDNILAEVRAVEEVFTRSMENTNNNFSRKFMEFVEDFDDNVQSTMVGAAVLDNLVPVEELYQNLDQHTVRLVQASALKELFRRGRDWSDVYFRFGVIDENLWKHASHDVEMIGLITDLKDAAKIYLNRYESDHRRKMAYENLEMTLDRLGEEGYFQDGTMFEDFLDFRTDELTPEIIRDVAKIIDKGDTRQVAKELQPPESISHIEFGQGKPKIYRRGVYAVKERSDAEYLHLTTYYEPPRHPVHKYQMLDQIVLFAFRGEDTGGRGVPNPALEYIVVPTELLGEYNPGRFLRRTGNPDDFDPLWIPSTKLGYELDKIDAEKIFGKAGAERIHEVRLLLENLRTFSKNDTAGANAFLHQALTPNTQIFNAIVGTQIGELFYNGDSYLNHLDAVFSLMGMENVLGLLDNAAVMELLLRGTGDRQAQIKTWLVNYRRGAEQLLQTHGVLQDPKENDNMSQPVIPQRAPGRSAMEQLYGN